MITDSKKIEPLAAARKLPRNSGIILRDYDLDYKTRLKLGIALKKICASKKIPLLIARDTKLALKLNADGIHFPQYLHSEIHKWRSKKPNWIITASAHFPIFMNTAIIAGANAMLISPIFATSSYPEKKPIGIIRAQSYIYDVNNHIIAYALGGAKPSHLKALKAAGFKGFAGISWVEN